ncbi:uncharacterized protein LOC143355870 [Halictus rubicundus]|uniref:uncharacterized protein LOC143355870 n=1 Tax=Halictus rubicundus TaxID=77578 RepID=UPI004035C43B
MSVPVMWIRNNMLSSDEYERELTDAELRVQRSLQNLSIPEWYLNKRSNPPKILNNTPLDVRPSSWKNPDWKRISVTNLDTLSTSGIYHHRSNKRLSSLTDASSSESPETSEPNNPSTGTYKIQRHQKSPNSKQEKSASTTTEKMDTTIPDIKPRRDISKTFPKMSPSRKLHNINIVLARGAPLDLSYLEEDPDASNYNTYIIIKRKKSAKKTNNDSSKSAEDSDFECTPQKTSSPNKEQEDNIQPPEPPLTPKRNSSFRVRTASTPKFSPASLFSSTILEESPKGKRAPSKNILEKLSIFEDSWKDTSMSDDCEKASQSMQDRTSTMKSIWREKPLSVSYEETPKVSQRLRNLLERNIRSVEPIIFEPVDSLKSPTKVQEIVKKVENISIGGSTPVKRSTLEWKKSTVPAESKDLGESSKTPVQLKKDAESPSTRPQNSRRISMIPEELKNIGESSKSPAQPKKDAESPSAKSQSSRKIPMIPEELKNIGESSKTPVQLRNDTECTCTRSYNFKKMSTIPEELTNTEESSMTPAQLRKDAESPSTRSHNSRRMSMVPEESKNIGEFSKTPVQPKKDAESPCAESHNSRRMSMIPEELKNIGESSKTPVQQRKDAESPSTRSHNSRRMSMVPEELKNIGESSKTPVQPKKDAESPCAGSHNSRRMSMIPEELKNIGESSKTSVQQRKDETQEKDTESSSRTRFPKSRRMSIVPQELKDLKEISRMLMQQRKEMEKEDADCSITKLLNSRRMSLASPEFKNMAEFSKTPVQQRKATEPVTNPNSPSTRFLNSRRKSMELENVVRSKQPPKEKSVVREIIEAMTERAIKQASLRKQSNVPGAHQNFVRTVVDAMEKGNSSLLDETIQGSFTSTIKNEDDLGSGSESDVKSSVTTVSSKDTESSSDSDQRSPVPLESDDNNKTYDFNVSLDTSKASEQKQHHDDDSVYWIPVSRCKLPRTSSLLSMMSRLSTNTDASPCVSPIKSDSENENVHSPWGATFRRNHGLSRKFFRIDETIVMDSGYSDRSDKSAVGCSTTDSNWSEDTQYESSGPEVSRNRITRASRRRSGIGATFRVSD